MKRVLFFLQLVVFSSYSIAQNSCYIKLLDAVSMKPIGDATYKIAEVQKEGISDSLGLLKFEMKSAEKAWIEISHLNYENYNARLKSSDLLIDTFYIYLVPQIHEFEEVVVTAFKDGEKDLLVPAAVDLINKKELTQRPISTIDDAFDNLTGVNVNRPFGVFGDANVSLRGIGGNEPARQLVMMDGTPIISDDRAVVNWNRINPESINKIEIVKGPNSALYGSNAMGGVIQLFTKRQQNPGASAVISSEYASYNTLSSSFFISGKPKNKFSKLDWRLFGGYKTSDGYIARPDSLIDSIDVKKSFWEYNINTGINYQLNKNTLLFFNAGYYDNMRKRGVQIYEKDGAYFKSSIENVTSGIKWAKEEHNFSFSAYLQKETIQAQIELLLMLPPDTSGILLPPLYQKQTHIGTRKQKGGSANYTYKVARHSLTVSADMNNFTVSNKDDSDMRNDPDPSMNVAEIKGNRLSGNLYIQDRMNLLDNRLFIIPGLNLHYEQYLQGSYQMNNPSVNNLFILDYSMDLNDTTYFFLAPRMNALYKLTNFTSFYLSYSRGYRTATFEDLVRSGMSREGFITPNNDLVPEKLDNYELGFKSRELKNVTLSLSLFYSKGHDFMYFIQTGQFINNGRNPIMRKENLTSVSNSGMEADVIYKYSDHLKLYCNYTYNKSIIDDFVGNDKLIGKVLTYTPKHSLNTGGVVETRYVNVSMNTGYRTKMFMDDYNTIAVDDMLTADFKIWKEFNQRYHVYITAQNIFDQRYLAMGNQLSIGRMLAFGIKVKL